MRFDYILDGAYLGPGKEIEGTIFVSGEVHYVSIKSAFSSDGLHSYSIKV